VLSPLLVRPLTENGFEIVAGARRYRAAQMAEAVTVPVRIKQMSDAEVLEAQLVENLIRAEIHPMEEAEGFARLLALEEPKYSIEQIGARVGKSPVFVASRLKLVDLVPAAVDAFYANEIGVGHALLLAKLACRHGNGFVPHQILDCLQIHTCHHEPGCERMPERVPSDTLNLGFLAR
jgi:ParB family chromosome partitioning protein